jgi:hypothetical protein
LIQALAGKHGATRLEAACAKAIAAGDPSYRTIKGILAAATETDPPPAPTGDAGAAAHLHGPAALFDNVYQLPGGDPSQQPTPATGRDHAQTVA